MKNSSGCIRCALLFIVCLFLLSGCGLFHDKFEQQEQDEELFESDPIPYEVEILADASEKDQKIICDAFAKHSQLIALKDNLPDGVIGLTRRAQTDKQNAVKVLRSLGYYDGKAEASIEEAADSEGHAKAIIKMQPGDLYRIDRIDISYDPPLKILPESLAATALSKDAREVPQDGFATVKTGDPAIADNILAAVDDIVAVLHRRGYPQAKTADTRYTLDKSKKRFNIAVTYKTGPLAYMGDAIVSGTQQVDAGYVAKLIPWDRQQLWDDKIMEEYREKLQHLGLFRSADITSSPLPKDAAADENGIFRIPVLVDAKETSFRSIAASARYATDTGFGILGEWEHRNFFGAGEKLNFKLPFAQDKRGGQLEFEKPCFGHRDQKLLAGTSFLREDTDAYTQSAMNAYVGLERKLSKDWWTSIKLFAERGYVTRDEKNSYHYESIIWSIKRDTRNNMLNPTSGTLFQIDLAPTTGFYLDNFSGISATAKAAVYYAPLSDDFLVLAGRAAIGSFLGANLQNIPPSLRFYCGGGGSVRGYSYQAIGPRDKYDEPVGGRSFQEVNIEARFRATKDVGFVTFVDGGNVYDAQMGGIGENFRWAAGVGLRYYTAIGPLRFDIAMPLNKRHNDKGYQFYISIGQAF